MLFISPQELSLPTFTGGSCSDEMPIVWWAFGMAGFIHGIVVMLLVCITVMEHHPIARYHERGPMTGLAQLFAHIVYGVVVGLIVHARQ